MELDNALRSLGTWGRHQTFMFIYINVFCCVIPGWMTMSVVFFTAHPENYYCKPYEGFYPNETIPGLVPGDGEDKVDHCHIYEVHNGVVTRNKTKCENGWYYEATVPGEATFVTDLNLVCDHAIFAEVAASLFMGGILFGALPIGQIPDIIGRKPVLFISAVAEVIVGVGLSFAWNYYAVVCLWVVSGIFRDGLFNTGFVLLLERTVPEQRALVGSILNVIWGIAMASLAGIAYMLPNWRHMQLFMSLCFLLALPFFKIVTESERWLIAKGREEEAENILQYVAKFNQIQNPPKYFLSRGDVNNESNKETKKIKENGDKPSKKKGGYSRFTDEAEGSTVNESPQEEANGKYTIFKEDVNFVQTKPKQNTFLDLFRTPVLLKITLILSANYFINNIVYFGLSIDSARLSGNKYMNFFLLGLIEIPADIVAYFSMEKFGRRMSMIVTIFVAGVACVLAACIPDETGSGISLHPLIIACAMTGKFMITYNYTVLAIFTPELMPTVVRNASFGLFSVAAKAGGVLVPYIFYLGHYSEYIPLNILGVTCIATGFVTIFLSETRNKPLPDTLDDATRMNATNGKVNTQSKEETA